MRFSLSPVEPFSGENVLPLEDAKAHLRVLHDEEDDLIAALRDAAVDAVEQYSGKAMVVRQYGWRGRFGDRVCLGMGPLFSVESVSYRDTSGALITPVVANFLRIGVDSEVLPAIGASWPVTADGDAVVEMVFVAGYDLGLCPPSLVTAAKLMLATFYANREAVSVGVSASELPLGFRRLCDPFRALRV